MSDLVGIGVDVVDVEKMRGFLERNRKSLREIFTDGEIEYCFARKRWAESFSARFAAKEAVLKAIGVLSGFSADWTEIELCSDGERPRIALHGEIARVARRRGVNDVHVSVSHSASVSIAQVSLTGRARS